MRPLYRNLIIAGIVVIILAGASVAVVIFTKKTPSQNITNTNQNTNTAVNAPVSNANTSVTNTNEAVNTNASTGEVTPVQDATDQQSLLRQSKIIVERYGTYSNRNNFENITGLEAYMTEAFKKRSAEFISERQSEGVPAEYYSIISTALVSDVITYTKGKAATIDVATRRVETKTGAEQRIFTQNATVKFQSVAGNWKVDSIEWQ